MAEDLKISAETRTQFGKGAARRIRRDDKVPAVIYGHGNDPVHLTLPGHDTMMALKHGGSNALLYIDLEGKTYIALTKQVQADPIKGFLEHIDFVEVKKGEKVTVEIPVHVLGESKADAMTVTELNTVSVEAEATNIPEYIEVSVEDAEVGFHVLAKDLALPEGSLLLTDDDALVVNVVHAPTAEEVEAELEEAEAEAGIERDESDEEAAEAAEGESDAAEGESAGRRRVRQRRELTATTPVSDSDVWLVVGLGNPGPTYAGTRHNIGYLVVEELARRIGGSWRSHKTGRADVVEGRLGAPGTEAPRVVLARARCYMNESGGPVKALATFYKVPVERIIAIHDELDIDFDTLRTKLGGGDNGHNGLKSMRSSLGSGDFYRVRAGIGRPPGRQSPADFVLSDYTAGERKQLPLQVDTAADAVESLIRDGLELTQQRYNS